MLAKPGITSTLPLCCDNITKHVLRRSQIYLPQTATIIEALCDQRIRLGEAVDDKARYGEHNPRVSYERASCGSWKNRIVPV